MILHVLPGDAIVGTFNVSGIEGDVAVCRECLVVGDVSGDTLPEFWENRERFLAGEDSNVSGEYHETVVREFAKLTALGSGSEINLWFEYELFCQTNMWFCLSLVTGSTADIFRVEPIVLSENDVWDGFGSLRPEDLKRCFEARVKMSPADIGLGSDLWSAYRNKDHTRLKKLSMTRSPAFPKLREVCIAAIEKESQPKRIIGEIVESGETEFDKIFLKFKERAGVYGYGDAQIKEIYHELLI